MKMQMVWGFLFRLLFFPPTFSASFAHTERVRGITAPLEVHKKNQEKKKRRAKKYERKNLHQPTQQQEAHCREESMKTSWGIKGFCSEEGKHSGED